ncbi:hypothetical protein ACNKHM_19315 [Shigella sonnei]
MPCAIPACLLTPRANYWRIPGFFHRRVTAGTASGRQRRRVLARLALRTARPRNLSRMRHAFQQLPELRAQFKSDVRRYERCVRRWAT